jgi:glycosyltransferase involved in cell wall biosynthesis
MSPIPVDQLSRRAVDGARTVMAQYRYPVPRIVTSDTQHHPPTVYFCQPDFNVPSGGIRVAYRHVDLLNEAGIRAAILHRRRRFRCTWFENQTRVLHSGQTRIGPDDLVVVGELTASLIRDLPANIRFVVFNQGPYLTWERVSAAFVQRYAASANLAAIVTVSSNGKELMEYAAPGAKVVRVHNSIDPSVFFPGCRRERRTIAYMPRRGRDEARQVLGILHGRGALRGWRVVALEGLTERQVADELRESLLFLSFAYQEGFGLPAAEAMACGSYVVGFHGFGGLEFFRPEFSSPVSTGDVMEYARTVERLLRREAAEPGWCAARGAAAARFISAEYSPSRERRDVVTIYSSLLARAGDRVRDAQTPRDDEHPEREPAQAAAVGRIGRKRESELEAV